MKLLTSFGTPLTKGSEMIIIGTSLTLATKILEFYASLIQTMAVQILLLPFNYGVLAFERTI